jgi:hypothetical protein
MRVSGTPRSGRVLAPNAFGMPTTLPPFRLDSPCIRILLVGRTCAGAPYQAQMRSGAFFRRGARRRSAESPRRASAAVPDSGSVKKPDRAPLLIAWIENS